ncbi:MAG: hypothetical protein AB7G93_09785 [Bdellovibrionales bacterium]
MLDLDALAQVRAKNLGQEEQSWRNVLWSSAFQELTQNMSDGEVANLVSHCTSAPQLANLVQYLAGKARSLGQPPYTVLMNECETEGLDPASWVAVKVSG